MRWWPALLLLAALPAWAAEPGPYGEPTGPWREQTHMVPMRTADGSTALLLGRVCRPAGEAPARVVVIAHGAPPVPSDRAKMQLTPCTNAAVQWFLQRGYLVVTALRRGYGGTPGPYVESATNCSIDGYAHAAQESARDVAAVVEYGLALPYARHDAAVVVGQSAGGWAAVGLDSLPHPKVVALVSMAGGRGGHEGNVPDRNCHPENLAAAAGRLGATSSTPMLWVYTENDSFFSPRIAAAMAQAFTASGGKAELYALPAFGQDGHRLFFDRGGWVIWGPLMERYLAARGV